MGLRSVCPGRDLGLKEAHVFMSQEIAGSAWAVPVVHMCPNFTS